MPNYDFYKDFMLPAYDEKLESEASKPMFFTKQFSNVRQLNTPFANLDVEREKRLIAVDVIRGSMSANRNYAKRFTNKGFAIPLYDEDMPITATQLNERVPGIDPFQPYGREMTLAYHMSNGLMEITSKVHRSIEKMCAEAMQSGTISLVGGDSLDFKKKNTLALVPSVKWDQALATIIANIKTICERVYQNGKRKPNRALFGSKAWDLFISNTAVRQFLDTRFIEPGRLIPSEVDDAATMQGRLTIGDYTLDIYTYPGFYEDNSGTAVPYVIEDQVIVWSTQARYDLNFGAVELMPHGEQWANEYGLPAVPQLVERSFVPYIDPTSPKALVIGLQSAPLPIPVAIDTIGTINTVDT
jgi:hypothetical protein